METVEVLKKSIKKSEQTYLPDQIDYSTSKPSEELLLTRQLNI